MSRSNLKTSWVRFFRRLSGIQASEEAGKKIPAAIGLAFFCWLAFDVVDVNSSACEGNPDACAIMEK